MYSLDVTVGINQGGQTTNLGDVELQGGGGTRQRRGKGAQDTSSLTNLGDAELRRGRGAAAACRASARDSYPGEGSFCRRVWGTACRTGQSNGVEEHRRGGADGTRRRGRRAWAVASRRGFLFSSPNLKNPLLLLPSGGEDFFSSTTLRGRPERAARYAKSTQCHHRVPTLFFPFLMRYKLGFVKCHNPLFLSEV